KKNLAEGLGWAESAVRPPTGRETFSSLATLAQLQDANGKADDSRKTIDRALNLPSAGPLDLHVYGRQLQQQTKNEEAMRVFEANAKRFPDTWPVHVGLARGHAGLGHQKEALAEAQLAMKQAPDDQSRRNLEALIKQIEGGKYSG